VLIKAAAPAAMKDFTLTIGFVLSSARPHRGQRVVEEAKMSGNP